MNPRAPRASDRHTMQGRGAMKDPRPIARITLALSLLGAFALASLGLGSIAFAQARVRVQVEGGEATVTLTADAGGATHRCTTRGGACTMEAVGGGSYVATAQPAGGGEAPAPRRVMVGDRGDVTVHLRLR